MRTTEFFLPIKPVPASRPRVTKWGTFFLKNYTDFRNEMYTFLKTFKHKYPANDSMYSVDLQFIMRRPKKPSNFYPVSDLDNLEKGVLDGLVKAGMFFNDDIQIVELRSRKRYQKQNEDFGIRIIIKELTLEEAIQIVE